MSTKDIGKIILLAFLLENSKTTSLNLIISKYELPPIELERINSFEWPSPLEDTWLIKLATESKNKRESTLID